MQGTLPDPGDRPLGESRDAWLERTATVAMESSGGVHTVQDDRACACAASACTYHRTNPQDPLKWCERCPIFLFHL